LFKNFPKEPLKDGFQKIENILKDNRESIEKLLKIENKTYRNFLLPLQELDLKIDRKFTPIYHLNSVENSDESQKVYKSILPILSNYNSEVGQDERLFRAVKELSIEGLNSEERKVINDYILGFKLSGAELEKEQKDRLKEINLKLSELSNSFAQNLLNATNSFEMVITDFEDVKELPEFELQQAKFEDGYKFTLQMPSYIAYMTYGSNREKREELYKAYSTRSPENSQIIDQILKLKREKANILGFETYADLSIATKMADKRADVLEFLESLAKSSKSQAKKELNEIREFSGLEDLQSYDLAYYSEKFKKKFYDIDEEKYMPYFEQSRVLNGLFEFLSDIFSVEFKEVDSELWNEKAKTYDIYENGKVISRAYLDLEARKSKKGGAWVNDWIPHHIDSSGSEVLPEAFVVCNFSKSSEESPSLLRHDDVVTLFHEVGHMIHHSLSRVNEPNISGINGVEWDAVEFPSQFLENFAYEPSVLKRFAKHYRTGETLPDKMIERLVKAKNFQSAMGMVRQLEFGLFDFKLYSGEFQGDEVQNLLNSIREEISPLIPPSYNRFQNSFSHIFAGGYSAGYYSYKWAEVLSADFFYALIDSGFDRELSTKYRDLILGMGGTFGMGELYEKLLGRKPDVKNLLRLSGIDE